MAMISIKKITITRGARTVIQNFSADIAPGSIVAITGPNGSGKSSLIGALAGDIPISAGSIEVDGRNLKTISLKEQAGMRSVVAQTRNYWLGYSVNEMVAMGQAAGVQIEATLKELNMVGLTHRNVTTLSSGELQRVDIARALVRKSPILLLDEPFSFQDMASRAQIIAILQRLRKAGGTILFVAHMDETELAWCDQIINNFGQMREGGV